MLLSPISIFLYSQKLPFEILVFLAEDHTASGEIYWDDGDSLETYENGAFSHIKLHYNSSVFTTETVRNKSLIPVPPIKSVKVTGLEKDVQSITVNGKKMQEFNYDAELQILKIENINIDTTNRNVIIWQ